MVSLPLPLPLPLPLLPYFTIRTGRIQTSFLIQRHTFNHDLLSDTYVQVDNNIILGQYKRDSKYDGED